MYYTRLYPDNGFTFLSQVIVINSKRKVSNIPPPAITIFARKQKTGWRSQDPEQVTTQDILGYHCKDFPGNQQKCIQENTFNFSEVIKDAFLWYDGNEVIPLMEPKLWTTHFTSMKFGRGYTLRFQWNASAGYDQLYLHLSRSFKYNIFIHDHEYFLVSENPLTMPTRLVTFDPNQTFSHYERLLVTEHQLIDNCEPEPGYSFQTCVQKVNIIPVKQNHNLALYATV